MGQPSTRRELDECSESGGFMCLCPENKPLWDIDREKCVSASKCPQKAFEVLPPQELVGFISN